MSANNEIGVLHPVAEIAGMAHERGALFHCDAAQSAGLAPLDVASAGIDLVSLSAHKIYGPKGSRRPVCGQAAAPADLEPLIDGGGHERGYRSGTLNVPAIVGFGKAAELCREHCDRDAARLRRAARSPVAGHLRAGSTAFISMAHRSRVCRTT